MKVPEPEDEIAAIAPELSAFADAHHHGIGDHIVVEHLGNDGNAPVCFECSVRWTARH